MGEKEKFRLVPFQGVMVGTIVETKRRRRMLRKMLSPSGKEREYCNQLLGQLCGGSTFNTAQAVAVRSKKF